MEEEDKMLEDSIDRLDEWMTNYRREMLSYRKQQEVNF